MSAAIAGVVGGLIAAGFLKMDGVAGLEGWRWLYIIEVSAPCPGSCDRRQST